MNVREVRGLVFTDHPKHCTPCLKKTVQNCFCQKFVKCLRAPQISIHQINLSFVLSVCQKLSKSVEIWQSYDKNNFAQFFFRHGVYIRRAKTVTPLSTTSI